MVNGKDKAQTSETLNAKNKNSNEEKITPLEPSDTETLADKITVNAENEDILTPVKDDKQDY